MDFAKLCDDAWESSLEVSADCAEAYARAREAAFGCESDCDPCPPPRKSDFLYDLIHLNVGYWMQLARLGSAYSIYAHRAIGALYGLYATPRAGSECKEMVFTGAPGDTQTRVLRVTNPSDADEEVKIELTEFRGGDEKFGAKLDVPKNLKLASQRSSKIGVRITIPKQKQGRYRASLEVKLGKTRSKTFPVLLRIVGVDKGHAGG